MQDVPSLEVCVGHVLGLVNHEAPVVERDAGVDGGEGLVVVEVAELTGRSRNVPEKVCLST
jgi:hypothetical protein